MNARQHKLRRKQSMQIMAKNYHQIQQRYSFRFSQLLLLLLVFGNEPVWTFPSTVSDVFVSSIAALPSIVGRTSGSFSMRASPISMSLPFSKKSDRPILLHDTMTSSALPSSMSNLARVNSPMYSAVGDQQNSSLAKQIITPNVNEAERAKYAVQDKLHLAQSLNDLFADLLPSKRPFGLSHLTNISLEQLIAEKVKLPRPLHTLIASLQATTNSNYDSIHVYGNKSGDGNESDGSSSRNSGENNQSVWEANELSPYTSDGANRFAASNKHLQATLPNKQKKKTHSSFVNPLAGRCYEPYGCFRITEPFRSIYRPISLIPEPPSTIKVSFRLRTRENPSTGERVFYHETSKYFKSKYFRPTQPLKIIVHGYLESGDESWIKEMSAAFLNRDDVNVICVDWMLGAAPPYTQAVANTRLVGSIIAHLIRLIQDTYSEQYSADQIHIIGHSLGAHIAGYVGDQIVNLGQITGLDPAEPYFQYTPPVVRLDSSDANFVDVVHTDVTSIISGGFGMNQACGHVDFYPNGGLNQPGCKEAPIKNVWDLINKERTVFDGIRRFIGCNHLRSFLLYIEAINSECPFVAFPCRNYEEFTSGQCTRQLEEQSNYGSCFLQHRTTITLPDVTVCPIRLGPNAKFDYRQQTNIFASDAGTMTLHSLSRNMVYFLQTAERSPFCHHHYEVTVFIRLVPIHRFMRNFRGRQQFGSTDDSVPPLSGRLYINIVGTRNRAVAEVVIKHIDDFDVAGGGVSDGVSSNKQDASNNDNASQDAKFLLKEFRVLISDADLGSILRVELEWRPTVTTTTSTLIQRPLMQMQSRAMRRWLSQLPALEASIPSVLAELQRTLNVSASQLNALTSHYLLSRMTNNEQRPLSEQPLQLQQQHVKSDGSGAMELSSSSMPKANSFSAPNIGEQIEATPELLEAVLVTALETGKHQVFCATETAIRRIFAKKSSKSGTLIDSSITNFGSEMQPPTMLNIKNLIAHLCFA